MPPMTYLNLCTMARMRQQELLREAGNDRLASLLPSRTQRNLQAPLTESSRKNPRPDWLRGLAMVFRPSAASQAS